MTSQDSGTQLAYKAAGEPSASYSIAPGLESGAVAPVANGVPYRGAGRRKSRRNRCMGKKDTCMGWKLRDGVLCVGCQRAADAAQAKVDAR